MSLARGNLKVCSSCRSELPLARFNKNRSTKDGLQNQCSDCLKESRRKWREANPDRHRARHVKNRYGIGQVEYDEMVAEAAGLCPVCHEPPPSPLKALDLDHDHATGAIRGLLCRGCNLALGGARDNPQILRDLADYVEAHRANPRVIQPANSKDPQYAAGESHPGAKLTEAQVREIRALSESGITQPVLAQHFGVTQAMVSLILRWKNWKHLPGATFEEVEAARRAWDERQE